MTTQLDMFIYGVVYVAISLILGSLTLYLFIRIFNFLTKGIDDIQEIKQNNIAVSLINSAIVFSVALFISEAADAAMEAFKNNIFSYAGPSTLTYKLTIYGIMLSHFVLAALISFAVLWLAICIFMKLTTAIDEFAEIKKNNIAVGIFMAAFILSMAVIIKPGVGRLLKGIIPFPEVSSSPRTAQMLHRDSCGVGFHERDGVARIQS